DLINNARYPFEIRLDAKLTRGVPSTLTAKISLIRSVAKDMSDGLPSIIIKKLQDKLAKLLEIEEIEVESIFELVDYDTSDLEEKIVWHFFDKGELVEDIRSKTLPQQFSNPKTRKQYQEMLDGL